MSEEATFGGKYHIQVVMKGFHALIKGDNEEELVKSVEGFGFLHTKRSRSFGPCRIELRDKPEFDGLCGPMWGGRAEDDTPILRYETWAVYNAYSI